MYKSWIVLAIFCSSISRANEGFFTRREQLPQGASHAWDSTLMLSPVTRGGFGSGFVIDRQIGRDGFDTILVLTAGHVVKSNCPEELGICANLMASRNLGLQLGNKDSGGYFSTGIPELSVQGLEIVRLSFNPDLALLRARVDSTTLGDLKPIPQGNCRSLSPTTPIYLIGHPNVSLRSSIQSSDRTEIIKRWSSGLLGSAVSGHLKGQSTLYQLYASTADSLPAHSGGPAITADGKFVGVIKSGQGDDDNNFSFVSNSANTFITRCEYLGAFIRGEPLPLLESMIPPTPSAQAHGRR